MPREEKGSPMGSYEDAPSGGSNAAGGGSSLAARRARLRGTLARATFPTDEQYPPSENIPEDLAANAAPAPAPAAQTPQPSTNFDADSSAAAAPPTKSSKASAASVAANAAPSNDPATMPAVAPTPKTPAMPMETHTEPHSVTTFPVTSHTPAPMPVVSEQAMEVLTNIDTALNACATNLAALQRLAGEQTDVLKGLSSTLQNQTLFEIGLNLNSLTESLTAALEPMKAMGELVPAMDQLVATLEGREAETTNEKLSPDQLVTSLADQLSAGLIDPWTFKCAYMAIYPSEHPADLLHRLVELLGTQRLSGDLFRAAYEAVQGAEPPANAPYPVRRREAGDGEGGGGFSSIENEKIKSQIEDLQRANEDLRSRQEERESELKQMLTQKELELQEAQDLLNSRYDEFNSRYEEVADALNKREEEYRALLESKDMELVEKESELNLLRAQMEELRNQTEDMVKDLQKQLADVKVSKESSKAESSSFFDPAPNVSGQSAMFAPAQTQPPKPLFESGAQQASSGSMPAVQPPTPQPQPAPQPVQPSPSPMPSQVTTQQMSAMQMPSNTVPQPPAGNQPPPQQPTSSPKPPGPQPAPTTPFTPGAGSYGSGVRAQVFEVIVRQALAGAPWREICAGPMQVNNISPEEVEAEVKRRQALLNK